MKTPLTEIGFGTLDPLGMIPQVEADFGLRLQNTLKPYTSYVNRVYGLKDEDGKEFVAKFYRPGRWTAQQILEEHKFAADCADRDIPVVPPLLSTDGTTLKSCGTIFYCLFPCRSGRTFDAETDDDWLRLGRLAGRVHQVAKSGRAPSRTICHPEHSTTAQLQELYDQDLVNADCEQEFFDLTEDMLDRISPAFQGVHLQRVHGDCHRGNILDRGPEGLLLVDFDDMMQGPAVQDLWIMLPGRRDETHRELGLILEGYQDYCDLDLSTLELMEPLRFMRMVHFLAWCGRQRQDPSFSKSFPSWGSRSFWIKEIEDFRDQDRALREAGY